MAHITHPSNRGTEHIFRWSLSISGSTSPAVYSYQYEEQRHGIEQENSGWTRNSHHQTTNRRPDGAGYVEPGRVQRNRGRQVLAFDEIGNNSLPGWSV